MKCPICGNENLDSTKFCIWCGAPLDTPKASSSGNAPETAYSPEQSPVSAPSAVPAPNPIPDPSFNPAPSPIPTENTSSYMPGYSAIPQENTYGSSFGTSYGNSQIPIQSAYAGGYSSPNQSTNVFCILGIIFSLVSIFCCGITAIVGLVLSVLGLIFAIKNNEKGKGLAIIGIVVSTILLLYLLAAIATGHFRMHASFKGFGNKIDTPEEIEEYVLDQTWIDIEEDTCLEFVSAKKFKYYRDFRDLDDYYYEGKFELYIGDEALDYIVDDLSNYGLTEDEVQDLADRNKYYKMENLVVLVLHNEKRYVDGQNDLTETVVTPYIGFFCTDNKEHALDMTNLNSFGYSLFVPEDEYEDAKKANSK